MKKLIVCSLLALLITAGTTLRAQDRAGEYLGLPGDNLNLYAVMNLFQESQTIEEFEKRLNDEDSKINNLDLNNDGYVDYIMVTDYPDGNVHNIVLQVALGPNDKQDVAVFTVERLNNGSVQIQLIGDDALYGKNYIVEPIYDETPNPGYAGRRSRNRDYDNHVRTTYFEVAAWPVVSFIYNPGYTVWRSSWYWGYYPVYWHPWTPYYWHYYYGYHSHYYPEYYSHYRIWHTPRCSEYNNFYYHHVRSYSPTVVVNINKGHYKETYSRPQSRRDGEAMYARTHSDRSSSYSSSRRTAETRNSNRVYSGSSSRRSSGTINNSRPESRSSASRRESTISSGSERVNRSAPDRSDRNTSQRSVSSDRTSTERVIRSTNNGSSGPVYSGRTSSERASRGSNNGSYSGNTYSGRSSGNVTTSRPSSSERTYRSAPGESRQSSGSVQQSRSSSRTETVRSQPSRSSSRSEARSSGSRTSSSSSTSSGSRKSSDSENSRSRR